MKDETLIALREIAKTSVDWDSIKSNYPTFNSFLSAFGHVNSLLKFDALGAHYMLVIMKEFYENPEVIETW